jgi:hypothetical protein
MRSQRVKRAIRRQRFRGDVGAVVLASDVENLWRWHIATLERIADEHPSATSAQELRLVVFDLERHMRSLT